MKVADFDFYVNAKYHGDRYRERCCPLGAAAAVLFDKPWPAPAPGTFAQKARLRIDFGLLEEITRNWDSTSISDAGDRRYSAELATLLFGNDLLAEGIRLWKEGLVSAIR